MANATPQYRHDYNNPVSQRMHTSRTAASHAGFFLPHLRPGMSLLDCGCGSGTITVGLAETVSPGQVTGIDMSAIPIERAQAHAAEQGILNIRFEVASIYELPFPDDSFDAVFANAVVEHLQEPVEDLQEVRLVLKPGGVVGVCDMDRDGWFHAPPEPAFEKAVMIYDEEWESISGGPRVGKHLRTFLAQAGFARAEASSSTKSVGTTEALQQSVETLSLQFEDAQFVERITKRGLADRAEMEKMAADIRAWAKLPGAFSNSVWCEAVGWKE